jgi:LysW-gamma-L-lysine carboxypeptidase
VSDAAPYPSDAEAIALLEALVRLYSPSTQEGPAVALLVRTMAAWGLAAHVDAAGNAVGEIGQGESQIVLLGHIDTAPGEIPVRREGALLYGRGAVDAKGPLAALAVAAARAGNLRDAHITVIGAVEEEAATSKGAYYAAERYRPAYCIIGEPSGWNRITLGYKGRLLVDYVLERPMSHTASRQRSAAEEAVAFWARLTAWAEEYNRDKSAAFATLDPSLRHICTQDDGLRERVEMTIGLRLPMELDVAALRQEMEAWRGLAQVTYYAHEQPFRAEKRNPLTGAFLAAIRAEGGSPAFVLKTGTADMNVVGPRWGCPIVAYGPGDSALDHTPEEHLDLEEYLRAIRVLTDVLRRLARQS